MRARGVAYLPGHHSLIRTKHNSNPAPAPPHNFPRTFPGTQSNPCHSRCDQRVCRQNVPSSAVLGDRRLSVCMGQLLSPSGVVQKGREGRRCCGSFLSGHDCPSSKYVSLRWTDDQILPCCPPHPHLLPYGRCSPLPPPFDCTHDHGPDFLNAPYYPKWPYFPPVWLLRLWWLLRRV